MIRIPVLIRYTVTYSMFATVKYFDPWSIRLYYSKVSKLGLKVFTPLLDYGMSARCSI